MPATEPWFVSVSDRVPVEVEVAVRV